MKYQNLFQKARKQIIVSVHQTQSCPQLHSSLMAKKNQIHRVVINWNEDLDLPHFRSLNYGKYHTCSR